ncbi:MAG: type II toxin-antitoxin system HipA family toxin [Thiomonas sp.]
MKKIKDLEVTTPQGAAGHLLRESQYVFNYDRGIDPSCEVSLTMPIRAQSYGGNTLPPIFSMNKPEGWLAQELVRRMAKLGPIDDMSLLAMTGEHQIGRLSLRDAGHPGRNRAPQVGLREILSGTSSAEVFAFLVDQYFDSGISGVQPKVMAPDADRLGPDLRATATSADLIVKSGGEEFPGLAANEFLCMEAARLSGLDVPEFWLSNDGQLFVMKRFDITPDGNRLGFEDMAVLMGKAPDPYGRYKYEGSYENIAKAVQVFCGANAQNSQFRLFESVALSMMVRNGDAHLKNFGVLYEHPRAELPPRLAPAYDIVTTTTYSYEDARTGVQMTDRTLALKMAGSKGYPTREELIRFGRDACHVVDAATVIDRVAEGMTKALEQHAECLPGSLQTTLRKEWDEGCLWFEPDRVYVRQPHRDIPGEQGKDDAQFPSGTTSPSPRLRSRRQRGMER